MVKVLQRPAQRTDRDTLAALVHLSGLDNAERLLVSQMLTRRFALSAGDRACLQAMTERHLTAFSSPKER